MIDLFSSINKLSILSKRDQVFHLGKQRQCLQLTWTQKHNLKQEWKEISKSTGNCCFVVEYNHFKGIMIARRWGGGGGGSLGRRETTIMAPSWVSFYPTDFRLSRRTVLVVWTSDSWQSQTFLNEIRLKVMKISTYQEQRKNEEFTVPSVCSSFMSWNVCYQKIVNRV